MSQAARKRGGPAASGNGNLHDGADSRTTRFATVNELPPTDPMPKEPASELGYARRLAYLHADWLRFVPAWRRWYCWDGQRWQHDVTGQAQGAMKSIARRVTASALLGGTDEEIRNARRAESAHAINGALSLAGTEPGIVISHTQLDADPLLLNTANGTFDLASGQLRPHDPADLITKIARGAFRPDARGAEWDKFLERVQPDPAVRHYLSQITGHGLEGRVVVHVLAIMLGSGANGKSTFINALLDALGDYAAPADPELLTARSFDRHPTGTADLAGLRLAVIHESDRGRRLAEATVKRLSGGDPVKARRMREDFWTFQPSHTFLLMSNHKPVITGNDVGIWRRIKLVPWPVQIPAAEQDDELGDKLKAERDAVLSWLIAGHRAWRASGFAEPEAVTSATDGYREESDVLARFIAQKCVIGVSHRVRSQELFGAWITWCQSENEEPGSQTAFSLALEKRGYDKQATNVGKVWYGLGLTSRSPGSDGL